MIAMERLLGERCFIEYLCWCDILINLGLFYLSLKHWSYDVLKGENCIIMCLFLFFFNSLSLFIRFHSFILLVSLLPIWYKIILHRVLSHITHIKLTHKCSNSVMRVSNFKIMLTFQLCLFESSFLVFIFQDRPF